MSCGIYKIENNINHQVYIGQSRNIEKRWYRHSTAKDDCAIHRAILKYGLNNFTFSILEECSLKDLDEREIYWIKKYNSYNNGYNETRGGQGAPGLSVKLSLEQVQKIRELLLTTVRTNNDIANEFNVSENVISGINTGYYWKEDDLNYPIRKQQSSLQGVINTCQLCGAELKTFNAQHCPKCASLLRRKVERPSKEILLSELQETQGGFTYLGKKYGVTDNTIRKWCIAYNLPTHSADYKVVKIKKGENLPAIRVQQIDKKTGLVLQEFQSIREAERSTGIAHITEASDPNNQKRKSAGGYIWKRIYLENDQLSLA